MNTITSEQGETFDLAASNVGLPDYEVETVTYLHARVRIETPVGDGWYGQHMAVCTHRHTTAADVDECGQRLARVLRSHRLPTWATAVQ